MSDVYDAFFEFSGMLKSKVDGKDPNAACTLSQVEAMQNACIRTGILTKRRYFLDEGKRRFRFLLIAVLFLLLPIFFTVLSRFLWFVVKIHPMKKTPCSVDSIYFFRTTYRLVHRPRCRMLLHRGGHGSSLLGTHRQSKKSKRMSKKDIDFYF